MNPTDKRRIDEMDADLAKCDSGESMSRRLGQWERRMRLAKIDLTALDAFDEVAKKHALRIAELMRAG